MNSIYELTEECKVAIAHKNPEVWRFYNPPDYFDLPPFPSPKIPAVFYANNACRFISNPNLLDPDESRILLTGALCANYMFPTYYVRETLLNKCVRTKIPIDNLWASLDTITPAATFILEKEQYEHSTSGSVIFIAYSRYLGLESGCLPAPNIPPIVPNQEGFYFLAVTEDGTCWSCGLERGKLQLTTRGQSHMLSDDAHSIEHGILLPSETAFIKSLMYTVVNLALALREEVDFLYVHTRHPVDNSPSFLKPRVLE